MRLHAGRRVAVFANFSEHPQTVPARVIDQYSIRGKKVLHGGSEISTQGNWTVLPMDFLVLG